MEAWNSGVITTWGEPLFSPVPLQPGNYATRHKLCRALQLTELTALTIPAASSGDTMFFSTKRNTVPPIPGRGEVAYEPSPTVSCTLPLPLPCTPSPYGTAVPAGLVPTSLSLVSLRLAMLEHSQPEERHFGRRRPY